MVKRTNYVHNLNQMILEYKREQEKFEVMEEEICNQQKEIENLRQLILSTNFMNQNSPHSARSSAAGATNSSTFRSSASSKRPSLAKETATKQLAKDLKSSQKAKVYSERRSSQVASQQVKASLKMANRSASQFKQLDQNKECNRSTRRDKESDASKAKESTPDRRPANKPKGLQTINKNVLNQKDNRFLNGDKFGKSGESKKNDLVKRKAAERDLKPADLIKLNDAPVASKSDELLSRISKLKSMSGHKFENQENPKECLGINKTSKGINKKARQVKSALKATKSSSSINRILS